MRSKWLSLSIGLGLLLLLGAFALLVSRWSAPAVSVPAATPVVSSTVSMTVGAVPDHWQQFSSQTTGYTVFYPPQAKIATLNLLPTVVEHTQINFATSEPSGHLSVIIRVYDNRSNKPIDTFLSELYQLKYRKSIPVEQLHDLMNSTFNIAGTTGYKVNLLVGSTEEQVIIPHKNYFYMFVLIHDFGPIVSSTEDVEMFNRFIATLSLE